MTSFKTKAYIIFAFAIIFTVAQLFSTPQVCDSVSLSTEDTFFYKTEQKAVNIWDVLFKNVNVRYEVTKLERDGHVNNYNFHFRETTPNVSNSELVNHVRTDNSIRDAVREHFNDIQRGNFHTHHPNFINPNAHGRGIGVYNGVSNNTSVNSPLDQFTIRSFIDFSLNVINNTKISFTNIGVYITIAAYLSSAWNLISTNLRKIVSNLWSSSQESIYATIHGIVLNQINAVKGQKFFPFIYVIFIFILINNLIGMIPYNFSSTSHFILTFFISFTVVVGSTILGIQTYKLVFFSVFVPSGCPVGLLPLLVLIELISYLARNISLGLRLAANVLSGHMLLNILSGFAYNIIKSGVKYVFVGVIPLVFIIAFSGLEIAICFIQAQVFSVLSSSYIRDGIVSH